MSAPVQFTAIVIIQDRGPGRIAVKLSQLPTMAEFTDDQRLDLMQQSTALCIAHHIVESLNAKFSARNGKAKRPPPVIIPLG